MERSKLREIPPVDKLVARMESSFSGVPRGLLVRAVRDTTRELRDSILAGDADLPDDLGHWCENGGLGTRVRERLEALVRPRHRSVINATGVLLHTGLGRAPLAEVARDAARRIGRYGLVEVDPVSGERGRRESFVRDLLVELTGAEEATVVNNNAAAVLLLLRGLARDREVVVSRGELVEIGGGFRVPAVMEESGARLVECGTTNRTRIADYEAATTEQTSLYLQVHTSNFKIVGFQEAPTSEELATAAHARNLYAASDLGSGYLRRISALPFREEPTVEEAVRAGFDVVTFSGDKMLGGPQCGVLVGTKDAILALRRQPLFRAIRPDKLTLAALEATLLLWRAAGDDLPHGVPFYAAFHADRDELVRRGRRILRRAKCSLPFQVGDAKAQVGSGSVPGLEFDSVALILEESGSRALALADRLRARDTVPVFARVAEGRLWLDLRSIAPDEDDEVARALGELTDDD